MYYVHNVDIVNRMSVVLGAIRPNHPLFFPSPYFHYHKIASGCCCFILCFVCIVSEMALQKKKFQRKEMVKSFLVLGGHIGTTFKIKNPQKKNNLVLTVK